MARTITPLEEPSAYVVTGKFDSRCGLPTPCCAAQLSSEIHVVTGADRHLFRSHGRLPFFDRGGRRIRWDDRRNRLDRRRPERIASGVGIDPVQRQWNLPPADGRRRRRRHTKNATAKMIPQI